MKKVGFGIISVLCALFMMSCVMNLSEILDSYIDRVNLAPGSKTTIVGNYGDGSVDVKLEVYQGEEIVKTINITNKPIWNVDFSNKELNLSPNTYNVKITLSKKDTSIAKYKTIEITIEKPNEVINAYVVE